LGGIGKRHATMVQAYVAELLGIHPIFDTPEQNIEDDFCIFLSIKNLFFFF
jgi:hypothetical protein